jgi:hypothetical protein
VRDSGAPPRFRGERLFITVIGPISGRPQVATGLHELVARLEAAGASVPELIDEVQSFVSARGLVARVIMRVRGRIVIEVRSPTRPDQG